MPMFVKFALRGVHGGCINKIIIPCNDDAVAECSLIFLLLITRNYVVFCSKRFPLPLDA